MKVAVAGATGAIGRPLVDLLERAGHDVVALSRATGVDLLDGKRVHEILLTERPEVVVHQATALPKNPSLFGTSRAARPTARLRTTGTEHLLEASRAAGVRRVVVASVAFLQQPTHPDGLVREDDPWADVPSGYAETQAAVQAMEAMVLASGGKSPAASGMREGAGEPDAVVLRYGFWYGPGTWYASDGAFSDLARKRRLPIVGAGDGVASFVHVEDAAAAAVAALTAPAGVYLVVDDEPARQQDWLPELCAALGAPTPRRVPVAAASLLGSTARWLATGVPGACNSRARSQLGWAPGRPTWRGHLGR